MVFTGNMGSFSKFNTKNILLKIFLVYSLLTLLILIMLSIGNVRLFNSLNLSMTIISNGGFLPTNSLDQIFIKDNRYILAITLLSFFHDPAWYLNDIYSFCSHPNSFCLVISSSSLTFTLL